LRILLIGKNGQVGSELCRSLCRVAELTALGRSDLDLTDPEAIRRVIRAHAPDVIINAAAYTAVDRAEVEEELAMRVNGVAPGIMAEEIGRNSGLLVHYSTDYVFDGTKRTPYEEHDVPNPINAYGRSKLEGERRIRAANCAHLIFRTSWVYNASGNNFLCTMLKLARDRTEIRVVDDQCGAPTWARTISETTTRMLAGPTGKHYPTGTFNLTASGETTWFGFAQQIFAHAAVQARLTPPRIIPISSTEYRAAAKRPANSRLSGARLDAASGMPRPDWRDGLHGCLQELR
jgi:dTDP-4-dehydrorhamnose reductase